MRHLWFADAPFSTRVLMKDGGICSFDYSGKGQSEPFKYEFQAKPGRWIGAKVGLFAVAPEGQRPLGYADFEAFRLQRPTTAPLVNLAWSVFEEDSEPPPPRTR